MARRRDSQGATCFPRRSATLRQVEPIREQVAASVTEPGIDVVL